MNAHRFFWRVKGRLPAWVIVSPFITAMAFLILEPLAPAGVVSAIRWACLAPLIVCFVLAYTYFAIALPLLYIAYLGLLFPQLYPTVVPYSRTAAAFGALALALGVLSEFQHAAEKRMELLSRYGVRSVPARVLMVTGALGVVAAVVQGASGSISISSAVGLAFISIVALLAYVIKCWVRKHRPDPALQPTSTVSAKSNLREAGN